MKLYNYCLLFLSVFFFISCDKDTEDLSRSTYYVAFHINGDNPAIVQVGEPYVDAGCVATLQGEDVTSKITTESNVDADAMGLYKVEYSSTDLNTDGLASRAVRDVIVCNPSVTTNLEGTWIVQDGSGRDRDGVVYPFSDYTVKIEYLAPGFFYVDDFLGGYYSQGVYAEYGSLTAAYGHFSLGEDNSISLIDSHNDGWDDELEGLKDASYNPDNEEIKWSAIYANSSFNLILKKQ